MVARLNPHLHHLYLVKHTAIEARFTGLTETAILPTNHNNFKARAVESKPRERIEQAGTASVASGAELLAVILKTGSAGCDVMELSRRLIDAFVGVETLVKTDLNTLKSGIAAYNQRCPKRKILGLGRVKILELTAAFELARRGYAARQTPVSAVASSADAAGLFRRMLPTGERQEKFWALPLDAKRRLLSEPQLIALEARRRSHLGPLRRGENDGHRTRRSHHHHGKFALQFRRQRAAL